MKGIVSRFVAIGSGSVLLLIAVIVLASRPTVPHVPGQDIYIGFAVAAGGPDLSVPVALTLAIIGFVLVGVGLALLAFTAKRLARAS